MMLIKFLIFTFLVMISTITYGQNLQISSKNDDSMELEGKLQIERILETHKDKVSKWLFTNKIEIDKNAIPFSHPVLTLNCNYLNNDLKQLANLLHEQFHWFVVTRRGQELEAVSDFRKVFPNIPVKGKEGGRDQYSTYLHLIVCDLEFQSMTAVVGEEAAREILKEWNHYTWIYDKVLNDKRVREINAKNGFIIPE